MRTHQFGRKIRLRDNRHQTSDQNAGMALYDVEKLGAEGSRGQDHHLLDAVETLLIFAATRMSLGGAALITCCAIICLASLDGLAALANEVMA
jgi:hypothetical protein